LSHDLTAAGAEQYQPGVDKPEPRRRLTSIVEGVCRCCIGPGRIVYLGPIEDIEEFASHLEAHPFPDAEGSPKAQLLIRTPLVTVVVVIRRRRPVLTSSRITPSRRIQDEGLVRIEAWQFRSCVNSGWPRTRLARVLPGVLAVVPEARNNTVLRLLFAVGTGIARPLAYRSSPPTVQPPSVFLVIELPNLGNS
jgi:hypothetical protein